MEKLRKIAYAGWIVVPALICVAGCGGDPPPVPDEVKDTSVEEMEEEATSGIELGTEVETPIETEGGVPPVSESDSTATDSETE